MRPPCSCESERGFVLATSLMVLMILTLLASSAINAALLQQRMATHRLHELKAERAAESAMQAARQWLDRVDWHACTRLPDRVDASAMDATEDACRALLNDLGIAPDRSDADVATPDSSSPADHATPDTTASGEYRVEWLAEPTGYARIRLRVTAEGESAVHGGVQRLLRALYQLRPASGDPQQPVVQPVSWREVRP